MDFLDEHCRQENEKEEPQVSAYDFLYLPIDFKYVLSILKIVHLMVDSYCETHLKLCRSKANKGFAFVNFTNPKGVMKFKEAVNNKRWPLFSSKKVCSIGYARVQVSVYCVLVT